MQIADVKREITKSPVVSPSNDFAPADAWRHLNLKPKNRKALGELLRKMREGQAVSALWSAESSQDALQVACLIARDIGCRVLHVRLEQITSSAIRELEVQLDSLFRLTEDQGSILVLDQAEALLCSSNELCRQRFENYLMGRLAAHKGTLIVVMPQHKRINPRLMRRLHFALAI